MRTILIAAVVLSAALSGLADTGGSGGPTVASATLGRVRGIEDSRPGDPDSLVLRDGVVSAYFGESRVAISTSFDGGRSGWGLHWGPVDAALVTPCPAAPMAGEVNYRVGEPSTWTSGGRGYGRVEYAGIFPGVTMTLEPRHHGMKYGLDISPGAAAPLRFRYEGATEVRLQSSGLDIVTGAGTLRESGLACHQVAADGSIRPISSGYADLRREGPMSWSYRLALGAHDPSLAVVVDPVLAWGSYFGGTGGDAFGIDGDGAIDVDASGNVVVAMLTSCTNYPFAIGGYDSTFNGVWDILVSKLNPSGTAATWSTYIGGADNDTPVAVAVDPAGKVIISGYTLSGDYPTVAPVQAARSARSEDGFLTKLAADGRTLEWSTYLGEGKASPLLCCLDAAGNPYLRSYTASPAFPGIANGANAVMQGFADAVVSKFAADGSGFLWSTYIGGSKSDGAPGGTEADVVSAVRIDGDGNVVVAGVTNSLDFPVTAGTYDPGMGPVGTPQDGIADGTDAFVMKLNPLKGAVIWSTYYGGGDEEIVDDLAVDAQGCAWIVGRSRSEDLPLAGALYTADPGQDGWAPSYVAKFAADGKHLLFASLLGGEGKDALYRIAVDPGSNVYIAGNTTGSFPKTELGFQPESGGNYEAVVLKLSPDGSTVQWASYIGGSDMEKVLDLKVGPSGIVVWGDTFSGDFPFTAGVVDRALGGGMMTCDGFLVRVVDLRPVLAPASRAFTSVDGAKPAMQKVRITAGPQALTWSAQCPAPWVTLGTAGGGLTTYASADLEITVDPEGLGVGSYEAVIQVFDTTDWDHPQVIHLGLTVSQTPPSPPPPAANPAAGGKKKSCGGSAAARGAVLVAALALLLLASGRRSDFA